MTKVIFDISMSLDGYMTAANARPEEPMGDDGQRLHEWAFGGDERNRELLAEAVNFVGAVITGRRNYDVSVAWWGVDGPTGPARVPVFVVTHAEPEDAPEGGVYTFVTDGIECALEQAKAAAGDKDVAVMGGRISGNSTSPPSWSTRSRSISCPCCSAAAPGCSRTSAASTSGSRPQR
jgi:dihydrofolate reductase